MNDADDAVRARSVDAVRPANGAQVRRVAARTALSAAAGLAAFCALAIFNAGGYRYGVGDQAFYIPAIQRHLDPSLFPRDGALLDAQARFVLVDEIVAATARATGLSLQALFFSGFLAGLILLAAGAALLARALGLTWWSVAALGLVLTLRHRIPRTAVNTLEGYFHPRMLVFAIGVVAIAVFLRGRTWLALALAAASGLLHPTIAACFAAWIACAALLADARARRPLLAAAGLAAVAALWAVTFGPLRAGLARLDDDWMALLAAKDYVFPMRWPASAWLLNIGYVVALIGLYGHRRRVVETSRREDALVAGALGLFIGFLLSLPLVATGMAVAVQLQVPRIFWILDLLVTVYLVWLLVEAPAGRRAKVRRAAVAIMAAIAAGRGTWAMFVEHAKRPVIAYELPRDEWADVMAWASRTPTRAHLLADPGHAWRYGSSVRVAGARDVYLEEVKDLSIALYSREVADRVVRRIRDLGEFQALSPGAAETLAARYDLDYLISERAFDLPLVYRNARFYVYRLGGAHESSRAHDGIGGGRAGSLDPRLVFSNPRADDGSDPADGGSVHAARDSRRDDHPGTRRTPERPGGHHH